MFLAGIITHQKNKDLRKQVFISPMTNHYETKNIYDRQLYLPLLNNILYILKVLMLTLIVFLPCERLKVILELDGIRILFPPSTNLQSS